MKYPRDCKVKLIKRHFLHLVLINMRLYFIDFFEKRFNSLKDLIKLLLIKISTLEISLISRFKCFYSHDLCLNTYLIFTNVINTTIYFPNLPLPDLKIRCWCFTSWCLS